MTTTQECPPNRRSQLKCDDRCPFHRVGLPVFPVRYAVVPNHGMIPGIPEEMDYGPLAERPLAAAAKYGLRLVRSGYIYMYDERRSKMHGFFVNADGTLYEFNVDEPMTECESKFGCTMDHHATASLLSIPNAKRATNVWFCFSDTQWTKATVDKHRGGDGQTMREAHMVCFNVKGWMASKQHAYATRTTGLNDKVVDYVVHRQARDPYEASQLMDWSSMPTQGVTHPWMGGMIEEAAEKILPEHGVMLALPDPTGIAEDISRFMNAKFQDFMDNPADRRQLTVSKSIESLQEVIGSAAETSLNNRLDREAQNKRIYGTSSPSYGGGYAAIGQAVADRNNPEQAKARAAEAEAGRHATAQQKAQARADAWEKYRDKYDEAARVAWQNAYNEKLKNFDMSVLVPMAVAHVSWMKSWDMWKSFECNYDPKDAFSGDVYLHVFSKCIDGTQDKNGCFALYEEWGMGRPSDTFNLLMRALYHNQDIVAEKVNEAIEVSNDWNGINWGGLLDTYKSALEQLDEGSQSRVAKLVQLLMGPLSKVLNAGVDHPSARRVAIALGVVSRKPVQIVQVTGSKKQFRAALVREIIRQSGGNVSGNALNKAVADQLRRLDVHGVDLGRPDNKKFFSLRIDAAEVRAVPSGGARAARAAAAASAIMTVEQFEASELTHWRSVINSDVRLGMAGSVLQVVALSKLWKDVQEAMPHESRDASFKLVIGVASTAASTAELVGEVLKNRSTHTMRYSRAAAMGSMGRGLAAAGSKVNIFASVLMAAFDIKAGIVEMTVENNGWMGGLYMASAGLSLFAVAAFALGWTGIGLLAVAFAIIVAVMIEYFKDNKVQDWLERTYWGKLQGKAGSGYYVTLQQEVNALRIAMGE